MSEHTYKAVNVTITDHDDIGWPKVGLHTALPFALYRADDITQQDTWDTIKGKSVSKSLICDFIEDPASWKASVKKEQTAAMQAGSVLDCLLTEPDKFETRYIMSEYEDYRSKASREWRDEMDSAGVVVLKQHQFDAAQAQLMAIKAKPEAAKLLDGSQFQVAFRHETKHSFASKGLIDILPNDGETIVDLKTCQPAALESKRSLARYIFEWGYHIQAGAYCEGFAIASGEERIRFKFIFVTSSAPFRVAVIELPIPAIMFGADIYRNGVNQFAECMETNVWPSIWDGEVEIDLPTYAYGEGGE